MTYSFPSRAPIKVEGPRSGIAGQCERVLRTLPQWFGIESALLDYVADTERHPTIAASVGKQVAGFITLREHFPHAWEVHCIAVEAASRGRGIGRSLHAYAEQWLVARGVMLLQVKTLAPTHPSPEYEQTRTFYRRIGYVPLETFTDLWGPRLPVLQLVKVLGAGAAREQQMS